MRTKAYRPKQTDWTGHPHDQYEWTCPDCENTTGGCEPDQFCSWCGKRNVVWNMTDAEAETDHKLMLEEQLQ